MTTRIPLLNNFLYFGSLKTGAKVIGFAQVIWNAALTLLIMLFAIHLTESIREVDKSQGVPKGVLKAVAQTYVEAFFGVLLLMGLYWDKSAYLKAWVVIQFGMMVQNFTGSVLTLFLACVGYSDMVQYTIYRIADLGFEVYATLLVYSYYRKTYYRDSYGNLLSDEVFDSLE